MMKTIHKPYAILIAALLILAGCNNPFEPSSKKMAGAEGTFTLEVDGLQTGRTILPAAVQSNFAVYALVFSSSGKDDVSVDRTDATLGNPVSLPVATWGLTVTAYLDSGKTKPVAQGSLEGIAIIAGDNTSRNLELKPIIEEGATGTFSWNIDFPMDVTVASMVITPLNVQMGMHEQTLYFIGGTPTVDTIIDKNNSASPLSLNTGYYRVALSLSNGQHNVGREEYLHIYQNMESRFEYTFTQDHFTVYSVTNGEDSGPGSLRHAIENAADNSTVFIEDGVGTIALTSGLEISKSLTIQGNGVTITRDADTIDYNTPLMYIGFGFSSIELTISRVHFKDGRTTTSVGAAICNYSGIITIESCIFSGNQTSGFYTNCGAIYNLGTLNIKACTFYNNGSAPANYSYGGAIYNGRSGMLTLTGNLFYGNTAYRSPVIYNYDGTVTSNGYNVVDVALGTDGTQSGWGADATDKQINIHPISPVSFRLLSGSDAANVIGALPAGYPASDFYGTAISVPAAVGAVQSAVSGSGYVLDLSVNNIARGSVNVSPAPNADGLVSGTVTITATPTGDFIFGYWLVNGDRYGSTNPLVLPLTAHTSVQAVFLQIVIVDNFSDASGSATIAGTLRHALTNAQNNDIIRMSGVTPGTTTIALTGSLEISKNLTIQGNGVTITRDTSWDTVNGSSQLIYINSSSIELTISRVHFKDGRATNVGGAAINISSGNLTLESCIFSGNQTSDIYDYGYAYGGAIYNSGTLSIKGCTFYNNSSVSANYGYGGAIFYDSGTLTLTGNLFYGNTATYGPVVYRADGTVTSNGYNVVDVALGTGTAQSGWDAGTGDKQISYLSFSTETFQPYVGGEAVGVITTLPAGYPTVDFYGDPITGGAAAGAVQSITTVDPRPALTAPSNLQVNDITLILTWNAVSNASGYTVDIDGTEYTATTNSYSLSGLTTSGTYTIKVRAKGNGATYTDSDWSGTVQYTVITAVVTFNPNGGNWNGSTANRTVVAVNTVTKPDDPAKSGYISCLDGWYKEAGLTNAWNFENDMVTADITLYAKWRPYEIGDTGPGRGKIFFRSEAGFTMTDNNSIANYLEAATYSNSAREWSRWYNDVNIAGLEIGIGAGRKNTALIIATDSDATAALDCRNYNYNTDKTDWFLPSRMELTEFVNYKIGAGERLSAAPTPYSFWSSSQYDATKAVALTFFSDVNYGLASIEKNIRWYSWAIRAF